MQLTQPILVVFWLCALALAAPSVGTSSNCPVDIADGPVGEEQTPFECMATAL